MYPKDNVIEFLRLPGMIHVLLVTLAEIMAKSPKKTAASEQPIMPRVGDKVEVKGPDFVRQISKVCIRRSQAA